MELGDSQEEAPARHYMPGGVQQDLSDATPPSFLSSLQPLVLTSLLAAYHLYRLVILV
jgi:hypothetical protein